MSVKLIRFERDVKTSQRNDDWEAEIVEAGGEAAGYRYLPCRWQLTVYPLRSEAHESQGRIGCCDGDFGVSCPRSGLTWLQQRGASLWGGAAIREFQKRLRISPGRRILEHASE